MESKNISYFLLGLAAVGIGYYVYQNKFNKTKLKQSYIDAITSAGNSQYPAVLATYDFGYLKAWAEATQRGEITFNYQGKTYVTKGGRAKI